METSLDQVERAQKLIALDPLSFVAGLFVVAFLAMLLVFVRSKDKHREEVRELTSAHANQMATLNAEFSNRVVALAVTVNGVLELVPDLRDIAHDARRRRERRESSGRHPVVPPPPDDGDKP